MTSLLSPSVKRKVEEVDDAEEEKIIKNPKRSKTDDFPKEDGDIGNQVSELKVEELQIDVRDVTKAGNEKASPAQFELLKVIGQGSYGKVFLVKKATGNDIGCLYA